MRRFAPLLLALALALPAAALAARSTPGDGSLVVSNADGTLTVQVKGVIFGHFDKGKMTVLDYKADSTNALGTNALATVSRAQMDVKGAKANVVYTGTDVRFLFPSGTFTLKFEGTGIDISAVGRGSLKVNTRSALDDGSVSVNGLKATPLPSVAAFGGTSLAVTATVEKGSGTSTTSSPSSTTGR